MDSCKNELQMNVITWTTKSEVEEFDRENTELHHTQKLIIQQSQCHVLQNAINFKIVTRRQKDRGVNSSEQAMFKIINHNKDYITIEQNGSKIETKQTELKINDNYKVGKTKLTILYVGTFDGQKVFNKYQLNDMEKFQKDQSRKQQSQTVNSAILTMTQLDQKPKCRFCLGRSANHDNPVIKCCGCKGKHNHLHLECLTQWLITKSSKSMHKMGNNWCFIKKSIVCEVCHQYFDFKITIKLLLNKQIQQFILLQDSDIVYALNCVGQQSMSIGRSNNSYLQLSQNTVSRLHAQIYFDSKREKFMIRDLKSKFGTLKKINICRVYNTVQIQVGRSIFKLKRIPKIGFFQRFFKFCSRQQITEVRKRSSSSRTRL